MKSHNYKIKFLNKFGSLLSLMGLAMTPLTMISIANVNSIKVYDETDAILFSEANFTDYQNEVSLDSSANNVGDSFVLEATSLSDWGITDGSIRLTILKEDDISGDGRYNGEVAIDSRNMVSTSDSLIIPAEIKNGESEYKITSINASAFQNNTNINGPVSLPNTITIIDSFAFVDCSNITSITIPDQVTKIGNFAFNNCSSLTTVSIGPTVDSIGTDAFSNCPFTSININPNNQTYKKATNVGLEGTAIVNDTDVINSTCTNIVDGLVCGNLTISDGITKIGENAFNKCAGLVGVVMPNSVTSVKSYAFASSGLVNITVSNNITTIERMAFAGCIGLKNIKFFNSIASIGEAAFVGCESLISFTINDTTPPTLEQDVFEDVNIEFKIYVPTESVKSYQNVWSQYADKINSIPSDEPINPANNNFAIIIGCSVSGIIILLALVIAGIIIGVKKYHKNKKTAK